MVNEDYALVIDTETTGITDPKLIEYGWAVVTLSDSGACCETGIIAELYDPQALIEYEAMATHGIMPEDLQGCPYASEFVFDSQGADYLIGHNVAYDWGVIGKPAIKLIDTCALARGIWPNVSHKLLPLMFYLSPALARKWRGDAHGVEADITLTIELLGLIAAHYNTTSLKDLYRLSEQARVPLLMPFGKHKGETIRTLPQDYKVWALKNLDDLDPYLRFALGGACPHSFFDGVCIYCGEYGNG